MKYLASILFIVDSYLAWKNWKKNKITAIEFIALAIIMGVMIIINK